MTLGDADFRKSLMKMIYRKLPKTASPPVTCHPLRTDWISLFEWDANALKALGLKERERSRQRCLAVYLTTLSARYSNDCGIVMPICFAVLRLITSSNLVGCSTGRSAGLAPFRILSM